MRKHNVSPYLETLTPWVRRNPKKNNNNTNVKSSDSFFTTQISCILFITTMEKLTREGSKLFASIQFKSPYNYLCRARQS